MGYYKSVKAGALMKKKTDQDKLAAELAKVGWQVTLDHKVGSSVIAATKGNNGHFIHIAGKGSYKKFYTFYDQARAKNQDDLIAVLVPGFANMCVSLSTSFVAIADSPLVYEFVRKTNPLYQAFKEIESKLGNLQDLNDVADVIAIKEEGKPYLFIRYR